MDQLRRLINSLTIKQRATIVLIAVAVAAALWQFTNWERERDFRPLYTSLAAEDAGAVVQKLRESSVEYRLSDNGTTVLVPAARVAEVRLEMASAGLPKSGRIGFELFDKTNFGMTEFAEHVNYRRALEGELERSVMALSEVEQARVHLTFPKESVFLESRENAKASVLIRLRTGAKLAPQSVQAITNLIASAVEGLAPESISVLDVRGNLLNRPKRNLTDSPEVSEAALEFQQMVEKDFSTKINSTLDPLLGSGKFRAAVSAECDFTSGDQSEETFDPTKSVMTSSMKTDDQQTNTVTVVAGTPGTTSNLPRPAASAPTSGMTRRTEQVNYQTSRLTRHTKLPQGTVKRLSVAVLLDQAVRWDGAGPNRRRVLVPPAPETVKSIHDLVAAAVGFSQQRGDLITVESLPFEATLSLEPPEDLTPAAKPVTPSGPVEQLKKNPLMLSGLVAGVFLLIGLMAWIVFTRYARRRQRAAAEFQAVLTAGQAEGESAQTHESAKAAALGLPAVPSADANLYPAIAASRVEVLAGQLRAGAPKDPELYASVLRGWLNEEVKN